MELTGSGGQGMVYRALDNNLNRMVALKLLRREYSSDPEFVKQFGHEARLTAMINHPNAVRIFSFGQHEEHMYLAMELVDRGTLDDLMAKLVRVPEARALQIGIQIAEGLRAGKEYDLIHRDVKPGNILFAEDGSAKIVDFGLAIFADKDAKASGEIWGTPYYLSPERLNRQPEDFRSDIYSLGATLFHAIAGRPPFEAEDAAHVALKHLTTNAASIQAFAPDVSNSTAYVINRTLNKSPGDRYNTYDEFIEHLGFARNEALERAGKPKKPKTRVVIEDTQQQQRMGGIVIATIILLIVGSIAAFFLLKKENKAEGKAVAAGPSGNFSSFGPGWTEAQKLLFDGQGYRATLEFTKLTNKQVPHSIHYNWGIVHQGLADILDGHTAKAASDLQSLGKGAGSNSPMAEQIAIFYSKVGEKLAASAPVPASVARDINKSNYESLALLFYGMKNWDLGKFEDGVALMRQFHSATPDANLAWLNDYKRLIDPYVSDFKAFREISEEVANAQTPEQRNTALRSLRALPGKMKIKGKLVTEVESLLKSTEERYAK